MKTRNIFVQEMMFTTKENYCEVIPSSLLAETAHVANLSFHYPYDFKIRSAKC